MLLGLLVGWEFTGLAFGSRGWPTLSGIRRFFMGLPAGRWALYTAWIWLGWDLLPTQDGSTLLPGSGWQRKTLRGVVLGAVLGYAWWAPFLRSDLRWIDIIVPGAVLLLLAVLGKLRRAIPLSVVSDQAMDWLRRQRGRAGR